MTPRLCSLPLISPMQSPSLSLLLPFSTPSPRGPRPRQSPPHLSPVLPSRLFTTSSSSSSCRFSPRWSPPRCRSTQEGRAVVEPVREGDGVAEGGEEELEFVEVGYVCNVHGLKGELKVKPSTDFPELRFCEPGKRWLRSRVLGKEVIREVELASGRNHPGQKIWIVSFCEIDTVEKAKQLVGSDILVLEGDRPDLDDGDFYTLDLVGMRVVLKETSAPVGTVVNVVNYGANDLLQVMLDSNEQTLNAPSSAKSEINGRGSLIWIPFVEAIVPDVDLDRRVMQITPPKGLLELNLRSDMRSKKERSQLEWKQNKKIRQRTIAAKKKLREMGQEHVLQGFSYGEKDNKIMLANQIANIDFKLFQYAVKSTDTPYVRYNVVDFKNSVPILKHPLRVFQKSLDNEMANRRSEMLGRGFCLFNDHKAAIILVTNYDSNEISGSKINDSCSGQPFSQFRLLEKLLMKGKKDPKIDRKQIPLIIVSTANQMQIYEDLFKNHDFFGFDVEKVRFLEEAMLPILKMPSTSQGKHEILLKSPWDILQLPVGSGGLFSALSSHKLLDDLNEWGIEFVQVCSLAEEIPVGDPLFFGFASSAGTDLAIKFSGESLTEDLFDFVLSMKYLNEICRHADKLQFNVVEVQSEYVELSGSEWIRICPTEPNAISFRSSIYSLLRTCAPDKISALQISD